MNQGTIIAGSIVVAGGLIAGAVLFGGGNTQMVAEGNHEGGGNPSADIRPIDETDHLFGNPNASIKIVEYSDFECPFCSRFHPTVDRVVKDFDGEVAWVFRHFPLNIHANAQGSAEASECVAELGGNDAFWTYTSQLFENQRSLGESLYISLAEGVGVSAVDMQSCLDSDRHLARVQADLDDALNAGGRGTPFSVVVTDDGQMVPFSGALPYDNVVGLINSL